MKLYVGWATQSETKSRLGLYAESENVSVFPLFLKMHKSTKKTMAGRKEEILGNTIKYSNNVHIEYVSSVTWHFSLGIPGDKEFSRHFFPNNSDVFCRTLVPWSWRDRSAISIL